MSEAEQYLCPACGKTMLPGQLKLGVNVGFLNVLSGFSVGTSCRLVWEGRDHSVKLAGRKKRVSAWRCEGCGKIMFEWK